MASGRQGAAKPQAAAPAEPEFDPKYEWQENASSFLLRLHLAGFRKEDFRVQVDGAGRLTVRGQKPASRFNKVFQLPAASNLDDITGRFEAGVLTLTVPKRPAATTIADIVNKQKQPPGDGEAKHPHQGQGDLHAAQHKEEATSKPKQDATEKAAAAQVKEEVDTKRSKPDPPPPAPPAKKETKAEAAAPATDKRQQAIARPPQPDGEKAAAATKAAVDPESLAARVKQRRAEEERERANAAQAEAAARCGWKERVAEELEGLAASEWAEGLLETVKKNKEAIAAVVAAFSLGLFVSSRLFSRN